MQSVSFQLLGISARGVICRTVYSPVAGASVEKYSDNAIM